MIEHPRNTSANSPSSAERAWSAEVDTWSSEVILRPPFSIRESIEDQPAECRDDCLKTLSGTLPNVASDLSVDVPVVPRPQVGSEPQVTLAIREAHLISVTLNGKSPSLALAPLLGELHFLSHELLVRQAGAEMSPDTLDDARDTWADEQYTFEKIGFTLSGILMVDCDRFQTEGEIEGVGRWKSEAPDYIELLLGQSLPDEPRCLSVSVERADATMQTKDLDDERLLSAFVERVRTELGTRTTHGPREEPKEIA
jgi:hypothetical protein